MCGINLWAAFGIANQDLKVIRGDFQLVPSFVTHGFLSEAPVVVVAAAT